MIGYVLKAGFLKWMRPLVFPWKKTGRAGTKPVLVFPNVPTYTTKQIGVNCCWCRSYMLHNFEIILRARPALPTMFRSR